jgi:drug/metabolite transporter (DMT)-like permease
METNGIMFRVLIVTAIATLAGAAGQILMRRGMQIVGPLESYAPLDLLSYFWRALCQPYIIGGTLASGVLYFSLLAALSWTGVSVVFPLTALEYGFAAVLSIFILKESVPPIRWAGIALVIIGVILIGLSGGEEAAFDHHRSDSTHSAITTKTKGESNIETR